MGAVSRIASQVYKNYWLVVRQGWRLLDVTGWPLMQFFSIVIFASFASRDPSVLGMVILGLAGWRCLYHFTADVLTNYVDEYWGRTLSYLFASPIRRGEIIIGGLISAAVKYAFVVTLFLSLGYALYGFLPGNPLVLAASLFSLILAGFSLGLIGLGFIYMYRGAVIPFAFAFPDIAAILSGVFYPTSIFPEPLHSLSLLLPSTYAFEGLRSTLGLGAFTPAPMLILNAIWLVFAIMWNRWAYRRARMKGTLAKLG